MGFPRGSAVKNHPKFSRWRRCAFDPWVEKIPWRRACQSISVFLPGKFHGQRRLVGYGSWGHNVSDTNWAGIQIAWYGIFRSVANNYGNKTLIKLWEICHLMFQIYVNNFSLNTDRQTLNLLMLQSWDGIKISKRWKIQTEWPWRAVRITLSSACVSQFCCLLKTERHSNTHKQRRAFAGSGNWRF